MRRMEMWTDALTDLYNSCLPAPCVGRDSPPLPEKPPERPPLPLLYTERQFISQRSHGFRRPLVAREGHHGVEWNRGAVTDRTQNGVTHQVFKRVQRSNQHSHQYQNNNVLSKSGAPSIHQLFSSSTPRSRPRGQAPSEWCEWSHDSEGYLSVEMDSPVTPARVGRSVEEMADSDSEYFTPRVTPRALRGQDSSPSPSPRQQRRIWATSGPQPPDPAQGFYYHSLPAPRSKTLLPKPSRLCISPQGFKVSVVEKPTSMRAVITPPSPPDAIPPSHHHFYPIQPHMALQPSHRHPLLPCQQDHGASGPPLTHRSVHQPSPLKPSAHRRSSKHRAKERSQSEHRAKATVGHDAGDSAGPTSQVDVKTRNVFGQPLLCATLKTVQSPPLTRRNQVEEDLRKLLVVCDTVDHRKVTTLDGTLYQCPVESTDVLHSPAMIRPQGSPAHTHTRTSPAHTHSRTSPHISRNGFGSVCELSEAAVWSTRPLGEHLPFPASVKEKMASICTTSEYQEMGTVPEPDSESQCPLEMLLEDSTMQPGDDSGGLTRQLHYLETILGELKSDLSKERRDKLLLLAEVECLRQNNHHLLQESLFAYEELHKLKSTFSVTPGDVQ